MSHFTDDILIQYAFDLLDGNEAEAVGRHIGDCSECRGRLAAIRRTFSALDVLGDAVEPSETLIAKTLAARAVHVKRGIFYRNLWVGWVAAAAAVAVISVLFLKTLPGTREKAPVLTEAIHREVAVVQAPAAPAAWVTDAVASEEKITSRAEVRVVSADAIPDEPPFAPASAIELVVLPTPDTMQLTIYNSADLTLVRDSRRLTLKPGWNWLQFMWAGTLIDPTSLSLRPLEYADKIDIQQLVYPAGLKDIGRWLIRSEVEGAVPFEITYFASGLSWQAFYVGTMNENETTMDLTGYVNVANHSGQDFQNARTRLIVGQTRLKEEIAWLAGRPYPYGPDFSTEDFKKRYKDDAIGKQKVPLLGDVTVTGSLFSDGESGGFGGGMAGFELKGIEKEGLSEYFLYTIEGTEDLPDTWSKRLQSLDVSDIPIQSLYKYDQDRYGMETMRFVSFTNDAEHELGETPIPEGSMRLYRRLNEQGNLSYIGGAGIKYIPVNEKVELNLGAARLVRIEPILMDSRTDHYTFDGKGNISGWDEIETWRIKAINTRQIPAEMEITRNFGMDYWELVLSKSSEGIEYKKHDKNRARFTLTLPPRSEQAFEYTVTKYLGRRIEYYTQKLIQETTEQQK